jgi:hypothetical protein
VPSHLSDGTNRQSLVDMIPELFSLKQPFQDQYLQLEHVLYMANRLPITY